MTPNRAVVERRRAPPDGLDYFPTPPWATRALFAYVFPTLGLTPNIESVWEPAAGEGHMVVPLMERARTVVATDVWDYGRGYGVQDFLDTHLPPPCPVDWVITNPPFNAAASFVRRGLAVARDGVFIFQRSNWIESAGRYRLFEEHEPAIVAPFSARVPLYDGAWVPDGKTATSYAWFGFLRHRAPQGWWRQKLIPPGAEALLDDPRDRELLPWISAAEHARRKAEADGAAEEQGRMV